MKHLKKFNENNNSQVDEFEEKKKQLRDIVSDEEVASLVYDWIKSDKLSIEEFNEIIKLDYL